MPEAIDIINEANRILSSSIPASFRLTENGMQRYDKQVATIYRIAKYKLKWSRKAMFGYILKTCPYIAARLTEHELKYYSLSAVWQIADKQDKRLIIQRLDRIQKRNKQNLLNKNLQQHHHE